MFKLYLAHPMSGLSGKEVIDYYKEMEHLFNKKFKVLSPIMGKEHLYNDSILSVHGYDDPNCKDHAILERDMWMVSQSDIILSDFTGSTAVSIGTCGELIVGAYLRKHTVTILEKGNIHNHAFILEASDIIYDNLNDAITYLNKF